VTPVWIDPATLIDRRIYRIRSRNLVIGAWDAKSKGFIGLREKFGDVYLFTEYEHDLMGPPHGTARAVDDLGVDVPDDIVMDEYLRTSDGALCNNPALYDLLCQHEDRALQLRETEAEQHLAEIRAREAAMTPEQKAERERISRERMAEMRRRFEERDAEPR